LSVEIHRDSLEYVTFPLDTTPVDPTTLTHEVAVIDAREDPTDAPPSDWVPVLYEDGLVHILVRASLTAASNGEDVTLDVGRWRVWWRAQANPEYPTRNIGLLYVR
jgi:hypothetical protein